MLIACATAGKLLKRGNEALRQQGIEATRQRGREALGLDKPVKLQAVCWEAISTVASFQQYNSRQLSTVQQSPAFNNSTVASLRLVTLLVSLRLTSNHFKKISYANRNMVPHTTTRNKMRMKALPLRMASRAPENPPRALHTAMGRAMV